MKAYLNLVLQSKGDDQEDDELMSAEELNEMCDLALKGIRRPKQMSSGQIQEIAWGFLVVAKQLAEKPRLPS